MKYVPQYPSRGFPDRQHAREWVAAFVRWYNNEHLHSSVGWVTPQDRHTGRDIEVLKLRRHVYEQARGRNPSRWSTRPRTWHRPAIVTLNPDRVVLAAERADAA